MKTIISAGTRSNPEISFDTEEKVFTTKGISTIVNAFEFYDLAITWINAHEHELEGGIEFQFHLPYFNSASMKGILMLMERIKKGIDSGHTWSIAWNVEDEDEFLLDACESFQEMLGIELRIIRS
jgi:hypothetical protein